VVHHTFGNSPGEKENVLINWYAMACGLPVVASPIGMNTEVVRADKMGI
jgi:hypothetical protein